MIFSCLIPFSSAYFKTPFAIGCSDCFSTLETIFKISSSDISLLEMIFDILKWPLVKVPVLSKTIVFTLCAFSKASLFFTNIPFLLAIPDAITIERGVASPRLQGHATTNTLINIFIIKDKSFPIIHQTMEEIIAKAIIVGTKYPLILSAILAIGAFVSVASTTILTISDTVDSFPIFSALYFIFPS